MDVNDLGPKKNGKRNKLAAENKVGHLGRLLSE